MPEISVIIPVFNSEKYIEKAIYSVLNQSFEDFECIIVNDGSSDNSKNIIEDIAKKDKRIKVFHKENGGQGSARNLGIDIAKGKYLSFIDSDDFVELDYLKLMYEKIVERNADICTCDVTFVDENCNIIKTKINTPEEYTKKNDFLNKNIYISNWFCDKLFKKNCFDNLRFDLNVRTFEDAHLAFRVYYGKKIVNIEESLYNYLQRVNSTSHGLKPTYIKDRVAVKNIQIEFAKENYINDDKYLNSVYLKTFIFFCITTIARYSKDYIQDIKSLNKEIDKNKFTLRNILFMIKEEKKVGLSLLLFKLSPTLFRLFVKFWFKNHIA